MQLIVTCAGCGAKYRGESGPKKFRCAACSNLFTFPDQPKAPSAGTILCSNCWTETVPTEKLKTCGFCSQRVSPRYGGLAAEDKQVKVKQPSVRNDPNLVKAVTNPNKSSGEMPAGSTAPGENKSNTFVSSEWKEIGTEQPRHDLPDPKKTQAFELMAELKKEIEPEMQGVVESIMKSQAINLKNQREQDAAHESARHAAEQNHNHAAPPPPAPVSHSFLQRHDEPHVQPMTQRHDEPHVPHNPPMPPPPSSVRHDDPHVPPPVQRREESHVHPLVTAPSGLNTDHLTRLSALETQLHSEKQAREHVTGERNARDIRIAELEQRLTEEKSLREASAGNDSVRELQAKVAELSSLVAGDKRAKDQQLHERAQLEELWRERDAKVAELSARLNSDAAARAAVVIERDELREYKRDREANHADMEARVHSERSAKEQIQRDRDHWFEQHKDLDAKLADMSTRMASDRDVREHAFKSRDELAETRQELEARIADLEARLGNEKKAKETLIKERDHLSDAHRELQARIADLESRLASERSAKENIATRHDEHLEAKNELFAKVADLESRMKSERESKESAIADRTKLHEARLELEARSADLNRRHSTEREAKERVLKEHNDLANEHRELNAKLADFKARLKAEQDIKENVRKERDEMLIRADALETRVEKSDAEIARLRKGLHTQLDKFAAEYNAILAKLAERTAQLSTHAAQSRKFLDDALLHHGEKIESGAADLRQKLEHESVELGSRLKKLMQDHEGRDSARMAAQQSNANNTALPPAPPTATAPAPAPVAAQHTNTVQHPSPSGSGRLPTGQHAPVTANEGSGSQAVGDLPPAHNSSSSTRNDVVSETVPPGGDPGIDKSSGTFWAKVFKRPQTKA